MLGLMFFFSYVNDLAPVAEDQIFPSLLITPSTLNVLHLLKIALIFSLISETYVTDHLKMKGISSPENANC